MFLPIQVPRHSTCGTVLILGTMVPQVPGRYFQMYLPVTESTYSHQSLLEIAWTLATLYHARCRLSSVRKMVGSSMWVSFMLLVGTEAVRARCRGPNCRRGHRRMPLSTANSAGLRDRASPHGCRALAHAPAGRRFLVVELEQGLTNQRLAIATYHLLAAATNRTLALDDFRAGNNHYCRRPSTASACTAKIPFEALFDVNVFARRLPATAPFCLRQGMRAREFGRAQRIERRATTRVVATAESIREYAATHLASEAAVCSQSGNPSKLLG